MAYELVYIVRPTVDEQALTAVNERVERLISANGGEIVRRDDWGKRRMAYSIGKFNEGFYAVLQINLPPKAVRDLERSLKLNEEILRFLVVRADGA